ncbi:MAG: aminotransferase class III-fold pyridoxal phosphate-dependent enzyme [Phenylobacterium sp.]
MTMINGYTPGAEIDPEDLALISRREAVLGPSYRLFYEKPVHLVRGEGVFLYGPDGEAYLDVYNNVACVGHSHPRVVEAIARQAATLNTHTRYLTDGVVDYAERLAATLPPEVRRLMFTCTGSEANDLALRIARAHTGGTGVIVTENAYHGVTAAIAELSPSLGPANRLGDHVRTVPVTDFADGVRAALADMAAKGIRPAALLVDTIFSSDGVLDAMPGFAEAVDAVRAAGGVFIADEVQAGFARTGDAMWGFQRHGLSPDLVTMGKPMGNGHPIAGVAARPDVVGSFGRQVRYFNTFGGNPVSCAAGLAVLDVIRDEGLLENAKVVGQHLRERLAPFGKVRGAGLFVGLELESAEEASRLVQALRERRVLISATGPRADALKIRPPLVFSKANVDQFVETLAQVV